MRVCTNCTEKNVKSSRTFLLVITSCLSRELWLTKILPRGFWGRVGKNDNLRFSVPSYKATRLGWVFIYIPIRGGTKWYELAPKLFPILFGILITMLNFNILAGLEVLPPDHPFLTQKYKRIFEIYKGKKFPPLFLFFLF